MVSSDSKLPSIEVVAKILNCSDNCQKFTPSGTIVASRSAECMAVVGYDSMLTIMDLRENCPLHRHYWHPYLVKGVPWCEGTLEPGQTQEHP